MTESPVDLGTLTNRWPAAPAGDLSEELRQLAVETGRKVFVLDDDPTGTQTVYEIPVITSWSVERLASECRDPAPACYILTNSRSLDTTAARALNRQIAENLCTASDQTACDVTLVSRSDSTLRGHFPAELESLEDARGTPFDAWVLCPFFAEGGRLTFDDVHYVAEGEQLVPAAATPFAQDAAFGFCHSNLRDWVREKSGGRIAADRLVSLSIEELRSPDSAALEDKLRRLSPGDVCIVNAVCPRDLQTAVRALLRAERAGRRWLYRTAASFVAARIGLAPRPLLEPAQMQSAEGRGWLVVVGSYVPKTTEQLQHLLATLRPAAWEVPAERLLADRQRGELVSQLSAAATERLRNDEAVVLYTSRQVEPGDPATSLVRGRRIAQGLVDIVRHIAQRPRVFIAKGGITSSDMATQACGVERAMVLGQALPGVPVWQCGAESRFPGLSLVVFPGNVGPTSALTDLLVRLAGKS